MLRPKDSIKQQRLHALSDSWRSHPLKGAFQILLSICLLALFFISYPSWAPTNHKSLKPTLAAFISNLLSIDVNRNLMFVVFNALLFLVTRGFGFFGFSSNAVEDLHGEYMARSAAYHRSAPIEDKEVIAESLVLVENGVPGIEVEEEGEAVIEEAAAPKENNYHQQNQLQLYHHLLSRLNDHDHHLHHHRYSQFHQLQKEEEEEDGQENYSQQQQQDESGGLVLTEDSDESFDNFIVRVKERMRMEARQLLLKG